MEKITNKDLEHRKLYLIYNPIVNINRRESKRIIYTHIYESFYSTPETNTTL